MKGAARIVRAEPRIAALDELGSMQLGPEEVLLVLHARFADGVDAAELAAVSRDLESRLRREHPSIKHVMFEFDAETSG